MDVLNIKNENINFDNINFDNIKVSTKTFTAMTNLKLNIKEIFDYLPITPYNVLYKKRGRKKKNENNDIIQEVPEGSIITLKYEDKIRGVELKAKKKIKKIKWFRNSITAVIMLDKPINFKMCNNGTFQMTGCKKLEHAELCIKYIWNYIKDNKDLYSFTRYIDESIFEVLFIPSMRNIDFSLGFCIDREKLNKFLTPYSIENDSIEEKNIKEKIFKDKNFHCLLETSFGYTGVNIKIPLKKEIKDMRIKKITYKNNVYIEQQTTYEEYLNLLSKKDKNIKITNERYNTFLVFHSGKVIMSGLTSFFMEETYYYFLDLMRIGYNYIEERLDNL